MRKGNCHLAVVNDTCLNPLPSAYRAACCCTTGKAWGDPCEQCPQKGTGIVKINCFYFFCLIFIFLIVFKRIYLSVSEEFLRLCPGGVGFVPDPYTLVIKGRLLRVDVIIVSDE